VQSEARSEQHGDLGEADAARSAVGGHGDGVLGCAPVEPGDCGAAKLGDGGLELGEGIAERVLIVGGGVGEDEVGGVAVEEGDGPERSG
jgi:hypothetical protein